MAYVVDGVVCSAAEGGSLCTENGDGFMKGVSWISVSISAALNFARISGMAVLTRDDTCDVMQCGDAQQPSVCSPQRQAVTQGRPEGPAW
jgi:hypothetical protein